jgi:hypothetical protein
MSTIDSTARSHRTGSEAWPRPWLGGTLPIRIVVGPPEVAALAVDIMSNTAVTRAPYNIDGRRQLVG